MHNKLNDLSTAASLQDSSAFIEVGSPSSSSLLIDCTSLSSRCHSNSKIVLLHYNYTIHCFRLFLYLGDLNHVHFIPTKNYVCFAIAIYFLSGTGYCGYIQQVNGIVMMILRRRVGEVEILEKHPSLGRIRRTVTYPVCPDVVVYIQIICIDVDWCKGTTEIKDISCTSNIDKIYALHSMLRFLFFKKTPIASQHRVCN